MPSKPLWRPARIAVLGAGIMGCSLALFLARRGVNVTLVDEADAPFSGASRWNEGKIHLGYLYSGDPSLATARKLLPGGLAFRDLVEDLTGSSLADAVTAEDDIFLTHRDSVVGAEAMGRYFGAVTDLLRGHWNASSYLVDGSSARISRLTRSELEGISGSDAIVAGFRVPERSVRTTWLADRFVDAVQNERNIAVITGTRAIRLERKEPGWNLASVPPIDQTFDVVVNALWHGRLPIDRTAGLDIHGDWSYRYRLSLFVKNSTSLNLPSVVIATGPFGDVKNYDGYNFYLSWYPAGLIADEEAYAPPRLPDMDAGELARIGREVLAGLGVHLPAIASLHGGESETAVKGGWVVAQGRGSLAHPASSIHSRHRFGVTHRGSYISVDTGKYSTAPWLARRIAEKLAG